MGILRKQNWYGVILCLALALIAWQLGKVFPIIGGPIFAIIFGIVLSLWKRPQVLNAGISFTSKKILQLSIILLGFTMNFYQVLRVGGRSLAVLLLTLVICLAVAYFVSRLLKVGGNVGTLIGVGTGICGGSAIAAASPVIKAGEKEVAYAITTIFLFNIIAVFIFPPLGRAMDMSDFAFGIWAGTAINDTSSVVAAAYSFSDAAGDTATITKLTRTLLIIPITLVLAIYTASKEKVKEGGNGFHLAKIFPWFIIGFVLTAIIATTGVLPAEFCKLAGSFGKFCIIWAMAAIGLNTDIRAMIKSGWRPIVLGMVCWISVIFSSLGIQQLFGIM